MKNGPVCGIYHTVRFLISLEKCGISSLRNAALSWGSRQSFGGRRHSSLSKTVMIGSIPEQSLWYRKVLPCFGAVFPTRCLVSPVIHRSHLLWLLSQPADPNWAMVLERTQFFPPPHTLQNMLLQWNSLRCGNNFATEFLCLLSGLQIGTGGYVWQGCESGGWQVSSSPGKMVPEEGKRYFIHLDAPQRTLHVHTLS